MSLLVTGSIAIDNVKTPYGVSENCLGGSAVYFSMAASFFSPVRLFGIIGSDCPFDFGEVFAGRDVELTGLEIREGSKTFRWAGTYHGDMNERTTDKLELNVLEEEPPSMPDAYKDSKFIFLANTLPALQLQLLEQVDKPTFAAADTMDCWIDGHIDDLQRLLKRIDCLIINDDEARMLAGENNLICAAQKVLNMGPRVVVVKKGESGSILCETGGGRFVLPAYPVTEVKDPTGAGDSFAGAMMGYLAKVGSCDFESLKTAVVYGTVVASFAIADFSLRGLTAIEKGEIENRFEALRKLTSF
ncbi:MAG: bifunctional hydroxymethylpyrimidine kinase/phosphomethylpyrimidine kinase [Planctomycetota bacterium]|nr:MAG: bifunctional hydroxymethylpyrimidine kinase/phosphomethylpyrimidine kinase [Planctomycetota bacterium]